MQAVQPPADYVDDITWNDLSMEDVYDRINACQTTVGQEYLYALLHQPLADTALLDQREKLINTLCDDAFRLRVQLQLAKLGKRMGTNVAALLFHTEQYALPAAWRYILAALLPLGCVPLFFISMQAAGLWLLVTLGHNVWLYLRTQKQLDSRLETISYLMAVFRCGKRLQKELREQCPAPSAQLETALAPAKKMGVSTGTLSSSPQTDRGVFLQIFGMITLLPFIQYGKAMKALAHGQPQLVRLYSLLGELDTAVSVLSYRSSTDVFTLPQFTQTLEIHAKGVVHPLLENAVGNDAQIKGSWLLTGSNASGKSTFIKALAVNNILAQTIHTCTAQSYRLKAAPVVTSMAVEDSVIEGESYFIAEIKSMLRIVRMVDDGHSCYCFIDEILKGTNTQERIAASCAVLRHLHAANCLCLTATHDIELTQMLAGYYTQAPLLIAPSGPKDVKVKDLACYAYDVSSIQGDVQVLLDKVAVEKTMGVIFVYDDATQAWQPMRPKQ